MSIKVETNINQVFMNIQKKFEQSFSPQQVDGLIREMAFTLAAEMRQRIHEEGKASDGSNIGFYSDSYMNIRTGVYANSGVYKRGEKAGQPKNSGVYTRGKNKGKPRIKYNRTNDRRVILSLTRNMENDFTAGRANKEPFKIPNGYGIGWKQTLNATIADAQEKNYKKKIFSPTQAEKQRILKIAHDFVNTQAGKI